VRSGNVRVVNVATIKKIVPVACSNLLVKRFTATTEHVEPEFA